MQSLQHSAADITITSWPGQEGTGVQGSQLGGRAGGPRELQQLARGHRDLGLAEQLLHLLLGVHPAGLISWL